MLDVGLYIFYVLLAVAVLAILGSFVLNAVQSSGGIGKSLIGIGGLVVLFVISYVLSSDYVSSKNAALGISASTAKLIGAGLILFYITLLLAALALIYSEITKAFK
jgi:hypothetical protein